MNVIRSLNSMNSSDSLDILEELTVSLSNTSPEMNLYKEALDFLPMGVAIISSRIVTWANHKLLDMLGYSDLSEVIGKNAAEFYWSRDEYERAGRECYPSGKIMARMRMKNGAEKLIFIRVMESNPETGRALVIFCSIESLKRLCHNLGGECA